jgi:hypothetical protein
MSAPLLCDDWVQRLTSLKPGWDSYDAKPPTQEACATLLGFAVVPCNDGGIQLEVHRDGLDIEVRIDQYGRIASALIGCDKE